jgi:hypothetical protein
MVIYPKKGVIIYSVLYIKQDYRKGNLKVW